MGCAWTMGLGLGVGLAWRRGFLENALSCHFQFPFQAFQNPAFKAALWALLLQGNPKHGHQSFFLRFVTQSPVTPVLNLELALAFCPGKYRVRHSEDW